MRFVQKRQAGTLGVPDLLFVLLIAHAAHNALVGEYHSLTDGAILTGTILLLNLGINWLGFHVPLVGRYIHPPPLELVKDGQEDWQNMRREFITMDELMSHVRRAGAQEMSDVRGAWLEENGQISVVTYSETPPASEGPRSL